MNNFVICLAELNLERINYYYYLFFFKIVVIKELQHRNEPPNHGTEKQSAINKT